MAGVVSMLREQEGLTTIAIPSDSKDRMNHLAETRPSVVVIDSTDKAFSGADSIWSLAERHPGVTVIAVAADSDQIHAVAPQSVVGARASDLVGLILCGPSSIAGRANCPANPDASPEGQ